MASFRGSEEGLIGPRTRPQGVFDGLGNGVQWTFDDGNRRESAALSNGAASMFAYDLNNRLLQIQHGDVGAALDPFYDVAYGYDPVGNRLYKQDFERPNRSEVYTYDQRHRLTLDTAPAASRPGSRSDPRASHATPCQGLTRFRRGTIAFDGEGAAGIVTPINDPQMPSFRLPGPTRPTRSRAQASRERSRTAYRNRKRLPAPARRIQMPPFRFPGRPDDATAVSPCAN